MTAQNKKKLRGRLRKAREVRARAASALNDLKSGRITIKQVLEHPPDDLLSVPIHAILEHTPKLGKQGCRRVLEETDVWPLDTLGKLSGLERTEILNQLPKRVFEKYPKAQV